MIKITLTKPQAQFEKEYKKQKNFSFNPSQANRGRSLENLYKDLFKIA